jgi:hypothetical protein
MSWEFKVSAAATGVEMNRTDNDTMKNLCINTLIVKKGKLVVYQFP